MNSKLKTIEELSQEFGDITDRQIKIVTTSGSFDILHYAHINFLEKARQEGDKLIILLNSDSSVKRAKGEKRPIVSENERVKMLAALECVSYIVIFNEDKPLEYIGKIKPNVHAKGGSFILDRIMEEKELIESWGGKYKTFELEEGYSTTNIIDRILKAYSE